MEIPSDYGGKHEVSGASGWKLAELTGVVEVEVLAGEGRFVAAGPAKASTPSLPG